VFFPCYRWASFRQAIDEVNTAVNSITTGDTDVKLQHHIGGAHYISVTSGFRCVDFRKFYRPYDAKKEDEIRPGQKGVALRLEEWAELCKLVDTINTAYPSLADAQPCYYGDDHMNQVGWLECSECHPFLNQVK